MSHKIACVNICIPYKGPGNTIRQNPVSFDVFLDNDNFKAVPLLNESERRIANLPQELSFVFEKGKPVSGRGSIDGNFHAIEEIVRELRKKDLL